MSSAIDPRIEEKPLPPGQNGLPLIGEALQVFGDRNFTIARHRKYGNVFRTRIFKTPTVFVRGLEECLFVLRNEGHYFQNSLPENTRKLFGEHSLANSTGTALAHRRKILSRSFRPRALDSYRKYIEETASRYLRLWAERRDIVMYDELSSFSLDLAWKLFAGIDNASQSEVGKLLKTWFAGLFSFGPIFPGGRAAKAFQARQKLFDFIRQEIDRRRLEDDFGVDILSILIQSRDENGCELSDRAIVDILLNILGAGFGTMTSALTSFFLLVGQHSNVEQKLRAEQDELARAQLPRADTIDRMVYLEATFNEVLRLYPPIAAGFVRVIKECEIAGYQIPEGWIVIWSIDATHLGIENDPNAFQPERFLSSPPTDFIPFGGGMRECLGREYARLEMRVLCSKALAHYEWELPRQDFTMTTLPVPKPKNGLKVRFRQRGEKQ
ncbi:cytochrome P450 [Rubidibacter lacunae KORDI 51-2]|uniref:Cytochrome P450 n=1 Tax=Rubidibacter lacunae KORDI 51-2 TaxID=582515 RepID=U5D700_9CHRO|nr:cytochrome P450 [Rubidibacter lacunae]ERN40428.1 cytochrome P450 [Rubidibacter lacunae KORDI 51-2]